MAPSLGQRIERRRESGLIGQSRRSERQTSLSSLNKVGALVKDTLAIPAFNVIRLSES